MNNFKLGNPWLLFLLLPLAAIIVVGFFLMRKEKRYTKKNIASFCLHLVIAFLVSFAFADPQFLKVGRESEVFLLVDMSASEKASLDDLEDTVRNVREEALKQNNTKVGVIAFAKNAKVVSKAGENFPGLEEVYEDNAFDYSATDIESALLFTVDQFDKEAFKRIVLVSDGNETDGEAIDALESLLRQGIAIDAIDLQADFPQEVSLTGIDYTENAYLNRQENLTASINAAVPTDATIVLSKDNTTIEQKNIHLQSGLNILSFPLDTSVEGQFAYKIEITKQGDLPFKDSFAENNSRQFSQSVTGDFNILFLGTAQSQLTQFESLSGLSEGTTIDSYIGKADIPYTLEELMDYDEVVLANTDLTTLNHYSEFVNNLTTAVKVYGKSVFTFDGTYVGNTNDPALVLYNDLLPVQYQPDDSRALVLIIDSSGSMGGNNLNMAIQGAKKVVDQMDVNDSIAVVTFDTKTQIPVTMTTIRNEENRQDIKDKIDRITDGGGTNMLQALDEAYKQIQGVTAEYKDIVTLSDGIAGDSPDDLKDYVTQMSFSNISCSFINILDREGEELMKTLAKLGNGQYRYVDSALGLDEIIVDTISEEIIDTIIEKDSSIIYQMKDDPSMANGVYNNLSNITGYNYCRMKSGANTVLAVQYIHTNSENELSVIAVPLYAYWNFGKGKVSSFTSSLDTSWTNKLWKSASGQTFFKNMVTESLPGSYQSSILDVEFTANGSTMDVAVTPNVDTENARVTMSVTSLSGSKETLSYTLTYNGTSFLGKIETPTIGFYDAKIDFQRLDEEKKEYVTYETATIRFSFDYSSEFNFFDDKTNSLLYQLSSQSGGFMLAKDNIHFSMDDSQLSDAQYESAMVWFLLAAVIVYLGDIALRKTIFKRKKKVETTDPPANYF